MSWHHQPFSRLYLCMGQLREVACELVHWAMGLDRQVRGGPTLLSADVQGRAWRALREERGVKHARRSYRHGDETIAATPLPVFCASLSLHCDAKSDRISCRCICDPDSYRTAVIGFRRGACTGGVLRHVHSG